MNRITDFILPPDDPEQTNPSGDSLFHPKSDFFAEDYRYDDEET